MRQPLQLVILTVFDVFDQHNLDYWMVGCLPLNSDRKYEEDEGYEVRIGGGSLHHICLEISTLILLPINKVPSND